MKPSLFDKLATLRAARIDVIDAQEIAPRIRNHLIQLFRAAHAVEPRLTGVICGNGDVIPQGEYASIYNPEGDTLPTAARHWHPAHLNNPSAPAVLAFLSAVYEYDSKTGQRVDDLPYINDITLDDITPASAKKAAIHGPRGLRARLAKGL